MLIEFEHSGGENIMWIYLCVNIGIALLLFYVDGEIGLILSNHRDFFSYNPYGSYNGNADK